MKKRTAVFLAGLLLFIFAAGCAAQEIEDLPDVLMTVDEKAAITKQDLTYRMMDMEVRDDLFGEEPIEEKDAFLEMAENLAAYEIAKEYGYDISEEDMKAEYENYMEQIKSDENYEEIKNYMDTLREVLDMTQEEFDAYKIHEEMIDRSAQNLAEAIAGEYQNISSAQAIGEEMRRTLVQAASGFDFSFAYPGVSQLTFEYLVSEEGVEDAVVE